MQNRPEVRQAADKQREADVDRSFAGINRSHKPTSRRTIKATVSPGCWPLSYPHRLFLQGACFNSEFETYPCPADAGADDPRKAGPMHTTICGPRSFPTFNIEFLVSYPLQGNAARGLREVANEEEKQAQVMIQGVSGSHRFRSTQCVTVLPVLAFRGSTRRATRAKPRSKFMPAKCAGSITALRRRSSCFSARCSSPQARGRELQAQTDLQQSRRRNSARRRNDSAHQRRQR